MSFFVQQRILLIFMVTPCINDINPFLVQLMHLYSLFKTRLKLGRLLQHVSVYKETIIREPVSA